MTEKKPVAAEKKKVKSKTFQTFTKRFVFSIVFILILVFVVSVTAFAKLPGKYIGFSLYMIASSLILFEGIKNFTMSLWVKIIICLGPIFFFIYPLEIFKKEIISPEANYSVKGLLDLFFDWKILIIPAFIGIVAFFDKKFLAQKNKILNFLIIVFVAVMISVFFKFFWLMNMYQVYFTIFIFCLPAVVDIFSYISGIALSNPSIKKIKLAPDISPNKTFIGFLVGFIAGFFYFFLIAHFTKILPEISEQLVIEIALSFLLPFFAIIGDLFFSLIKRHLGIKDFSKVLPGHGGFLDRIDSWIFVFLLLVITFTVL